MKAKKKQDKFNEIMKRGQALLASAEPDPVALSGVAQELQALGYTKEAEQFANASRKRGEQAAQRARVGGLLTQASTSKGITPEYAQDFVATGGTLEQLAQGRTAADALNEPLREKGRGRLRAMAQMELFDPQDPGQLQGYKNVAERHKVSFNEAMQILTKERGTQAERAKTRATVTGKPSYTTVGKIRDSRGLDYNLTEVRTGEGDIKINYEPTGHDTPWTPVLEDGKSNKPTWLGGAYTESGTDKSGRAIKEAEAKADINVLEAKGIREVQNFEDVRDKSMQRFPAVREGLNDVNTLLEIVEELEQGGSLTAMQDRVEKVLGVQTEDAGVFNNLAKELLVNRIKAFGANPTEGERNYLEQLIPSLENTQEINTAILTRMKERLERERASIFYITQPNTTRDSYIKFVNGLYETPDSGTTGKRRVSFKDLPDD